MNLAEIEGIFFINFAEIGEYAICIVDPTGVDAPVSFYQDMHYT